MHSSFSKLFIILIIVISMTILPAFAENTPAGDDAKFLTDVTNDGVQLLFEIPSAMKTAFFQGTDTTVATVGQEQTTALDAFLTKIHAYTLTGDMKTLRDQYIASADVYKKDLTEYSTLTTSCGSCIEQMNEMYPRLTDEAKKVNKQVILFYQKSGAQVS